MNNIEEGHSTIYLFDLHHNVYSEVASKKPRKAITISYQNEDFNKSSFGRVILSQFRLQRLNLDKSALVDIILIYIIRE